MSTTGPGPGRNPGQEPSPHRQLHINKNRKEVGTAMEKRNPLPEEQRAEIREDLDRGAEPAAQQPPAKPRPARGKPRPDLAWHDHAACNGDDLHLFYDHEGETRHARDIREALARQLCGWCPVRDDCLTHALTYPERHGIWGGLDEDERDRIRKNRREARRRAAAKQNTAGRGEDAA